MNNEKDIISPLREPVSPPTNLVDEKGQAIFGTFNKEIKNINLLDCYRPTGKKLTKTLQNLKLTRWEATELTTKTHAIVTAVYAMGSLGFAFIVCFNRNTNEITSHLHFSCGKKICICKNLIDSNTSLCSKKISVKNKNDMDKGLAHLEGYSKNKKNNISFNVDLARLSPPSIVSIPFGENMPLYTQKDFFKAKGKLNIDGKELLLDDEAVAITDDHKGYYPRPAHYDWLTTMGKAKDENGNLVNLAFNLTKNQSIDEYNYNENLLWLDNKSCPLPIINFDKSKKDEWHVYDKYKKIDIIFEIKNAFKMKANLGLVGVDYSLPFGTIYGYVMDNEDNKYILDGMIGIAEDKSTLL